jgi:glycosyltransferase involved in cell wall biosynthesis
MMEQHGVAAGRLRADGVLIIEQGGRGGVADYTGCLAGALAERGIPVTLATADDHLYGVDPLVRIAPLFHYVRGSSRAARIARRYGLGRVLNGLGFLASVPRLAVLARHSAVVHVQGWERNSLGLVATFALRAVGARIVYTSHNTFERRPLSIDGGRVFPALARSTIVHTEADRGAIAGDVVVIPHGHYGSVAETAAGFDPDTARRALGLPGDALVVLLFGVLRPDKGLNDLLDAAAHAAEWRVLVAGEDDGALAAAQSRLAAPELAERVTVHEGFQRLDQVGRLFAAADLVALPYRRASQSGVLHLAYGFGRPVVAYPVGGLVEAVVPGSTGWICSEPTPAALAADLRAAGELGRQQLGRMGDDARRWAAERFDWKRIAQATEVVYESALR